MYARSLLLLLAFALLPAFGNDIRVTQASLTGHDALNGHVRVRFDIQWQNTRLNNDRDPILLNVGGAVPTATRSAQLP